MVPNSPPTKDSELGTFRHALAELALSKAKHPKNFIGKKIKYELVTCGISQIKKRVVTKDDAYSAGRYYSYVTETAGSAKLYIERKVKLIKNVWGTADCIFVKKETIKKGRLFKTLYVVDFKNGYVQVEAKSNVQLIVYGLAALKKFKNINRVCLVIVQPNGEGDTIKEWSLRAKKLKRYEPKILKTVERIENGDVTLNIGPSCKWCKASKMGICPERYRSISGIKKRDLKTVSIAELQELADQKEQILDFFKNIDSMLFHVISHGAKVPGYKVVPKRATTYWKEEPEKLLETFKKLGYSEKFIQREMVRTTPRTPGQLRDLLGEKLIDKMSEKRSSGVKLVKATDPGEPVNNLIQDFED
jgi:hypothetical protein